MNVSKNPRVKYHLENRLAQRIINANNEMIAIVIITLNKLFPKEFYPKKIIELLNSQREYIKTMDNYVDDGIYDYKSKQLGDRFGISDNICQEIVERQICMRYQKDGEILAKNLRIIYQNLKFLLINISAEFGYGYSRMSRLYTALLNAEIKDPLEEVKKFGIDLWVDIEDVDFRNFKLKKERAASYADGKRGQQGLAALKAYQDAILKEA